MSVRPISPSDLPACTHVFMAAYNGMPWNYQWSEPDALQYLTEYTESRHFIGFVVLDGDRVAGAMFARYRTWWNNKQIYVDELFISPDAQGKGLGKQLISHAEAYCLDNNIEMITLMTNKFMPAMKFYENLDFIKVDQFAFLFKQV